jgi:integrase
VGRGVVAESKPSSRAPPKRAELFEKSDLRRPIRAHDLRATFITLALARGKSEQWVMDRSGHTTSMMLQRYRRAARTVAEANMTTLTPLDEAIPELASFIVKTEAEGAA